MKLKILCQRNEEHGQRNGHIIEGADEGKQKGLRKERVRIYTKKKVHVFTKHSGWSNQRTSFIVTLIFIFFFGNSIKNLRLGKA